MGQRLDSELDSPHCLNRMLTEGDACEDWLCRPGYTDPDRSKRLFVGAQPHKALGHTVDQARPNPVSERAVKVLFAGLMLALRRLVDRPRLYRCTVLRREAEGRKSKVIVKIGQNGIEIVAPVRRQHQFRRPDCGVVPVDHFRQQLRGGASQLEMVDIAVKCYVVDGQPHTLLLWR